MRRISTGQIGDTVLGTLVTEDNTVRPLATTDSLSLTGDTVEVDVAFEITGGNSLRVYNGSNYVDLNAPAISTNVNFTLPNSTGNTGDVLRSDGAGNLSFVDVAFDVSNQTADTATYYPLMSTSSSGEITGVTTTTGKLQFQPSSGKLTVDTLSSNNVDITGGNIDGTTIGNSSAAPGTFSSITETSSRILKTNFSPLDTSLEKVLNLEGLNYIRKSTGETETGFIAEEVEKIIPEIVKNTNNYKSISYSRLTAYLVEAIKKLNDKIENQSR